MTYIDYYRQLARDVSEKEDFIRAKVLKLKGDKATLTVDERQTYMDMLIDLQWIQSKYQKVSQLIISGKVAASDELDENILGFSTPDKAVTVN